MPTDYGNMQGGNNLAAASPGRGASAMLPVGYNKMGEPQALGAALPGQLNRAAAFYASKFRKGQSRIFGVGDSWTVGQGASVPANNYYQLVKAAVAGNLVVGCYAVGGRTIYAYRQNVLNDGTGAASLDQHQTRIDDIFFGIWGLNDLRGVAAESGSDPVNIPQLHRRVQAAATWCMVPETSRTRMHTVTNSGANPAVIFTGTWNHGGYNGNTNWSFTQTVNDSCSFTVPAGDLLIIRHGVSPAATGIWSVAVDGVTVGQVSSKCTYGADWALSCTLFRLPPTTAATRSIVLKLLSGDVLMPDSVDCLDTTRDFSATLVYSGPGYLVDAANTGWSDPSGAANGATALGATGGAAYTLNNGGCDRFSAAIDSAMSQLFELGFNVVNCHARVGFDPTVHTDSADRVHPNDRGHAHLAQGFLNCIRTLLPV